jgi:hypothetical protein
VKSCTHRQIEINSSNVHIENSFHVTKIRRCHNVGTYKWTEHHERQRDKGERAERKAYIGAFMQPLSLKLDDGPGAKRERASGTLIFASERASSLALSRVCGGPSVCLALVCLLLSSAFLDRND